MGHWEETGSRHESGSGCADLGNSRESLAKTLKGTRRRRQIQETLRLHGRTQSVTKWQSILCFPDWVGGDHQHWEERCQEARARQGNSYGKKIFSTFQITNFILILPS